MIAHPMMTGMSLPPGPTHTTEAFLHCQGDRLPLTRMYGRRQADELENAMRELKQAKAMILKGREPKRQPRAEIKAKVSAT
jgi:hypothetical protein